MIEIYFVIKRDDTGYLTLKGKFSKFKKYASGYKDYVSAEQAIEQLKLKGVYSIEKYFEIK